MATAPVEHAACRTVGADFRARGDALALLFPSVIMPQERNALVNPPHAAIAGVRVVADEPFRLDPRLLS